jgi:serralysin
MVLDVLGLQFMYGVNTSTFAGDTTHALTSEDYYYTIWDASGIDRVDASGQSEGWTIFLPDFAATPLLETLSGFAMPSSQFDGTLVDSAPTEMIWLMGDIENATGSAFDDWINGTPLDNDLRGGGGNDELEGFAGNDVIDGNDGLDLAYYPGSQTSYTLTLGADAITVQDRRADGVGTDTLRNIEIVEFYSEDDRQTLDLQQFGGPASLSGADLESFIELYIAYFNRAPDALGLNFWGTAFANGTTLQEMASLFIDQPETRATYAEDLSNEDFATAVYENVLGRVPDQDGFEFWVGVLDSGAVSRDQFILSVLEGAKADAPVGASQDFIDQQQADRAFLADKTDIGALYAVHRGMSDVDNAIAVMSQFDGSESSLSEAVSTIEQLYSAALDPDTGAFLMPVVGVLDNPFDAIA